MNSEHSIPLSLDRRIQSYLRANVSAGRDTARIGPFLASSDPASANMYRNYAVPQDGANPEPSEISALIGWFEQRSRVARLEYLPSVAPHVEQALVRSGFSVEGRLPVMICKMETGTHCPCPEGIELLAAQDDLTLRVAAQAQNEAYGEECATEADVARLRRTVQSGGMVLLARDWHTGEGAGAGLYSAPFEGVTEIAAIGVRPGFRRRGIAGALTSHLNQAAIESGIQIAFLMAAGPAEERLYARAGFVTCSQILHISKERPG
jgi:GNAT superfamily N-acetyltransferase